MVSSIRLLVFAALSLPALLWADFPTSEEVNEALDLEGAIELNWTLEARGEASGEVSVEVVERAGARDGTALKVSVPQGSELEFSSELIGRYVADFRYTHDVEPVRMEVLDGTYYPDSVHSEAVPEPGEWKEVTLNYLVATANQANRNFGWTVRNRGVGSPDIVFYLDDLRLEPGMLVEVEEVSATGTKTPDKRVYLEGETVTLEASVEEGYEFYGWRFSSGLVREVETDFEVSFPQTIRAIGARVIRFGDLEVAVPLDSRSVDADELEGTLRIVADGYVDDPILFRAEGPGFIFCQAEAWESSPRFAGEYVRDEPLLVERWVGAGEVELALEARGSFALSGFEFEPGYPVEVSVQGEGSVQGLPEWGRSGVGESLRLEAEPAEGWSFGGWTGSVVSENELLEIGVNDPVELTAVFVKRQHLDGFEVTVDERLDLSTIVDASGEEALSLKAADLSTTTVYATIPVVGPGVLTLEYKSPLGQGTIELDDRWVESFTESASAKSVSMEIGEGQSEVTLRLDAHLTGYAVDFSIMGIDFQPGLALTVPEVEGGAVSGKPDRERLPMGTRVSLEATPEAGYEFVGWVGDVTGSERALSFEMIRPIAVAPVFSRAVADDPLVNEVVGTLQWRKVDGLWRSPETLPKESSAILRGQVNGPSRLRVEVETAESFGGMAIYVDGEYASGWWQGIPIGEGAHDVEIVVKADSKGDYSPKTLRVFQLEYPVRLFLNGATLESETVFEAVDPLGAESTLWATTWVRAGDAVAFSLSDEGGREFLGWTGALEGQSATGSVVVEGPITSAARLARTEVEVDGQVWKVEGGEGLLPEEWDDRYPVLLNSLVEEVRLTRTFEGPGYFSAAETGLMLGLEVGGETVDGFRGFVYLAEGEQELALLLRPEADFPADVWQSKYQVLRGVFFGEGIFPSAVGWAGGRVSIEPDKDVYEKGDVVTFVATPDEGNEFGGWILPERSMANRFTYVVEDRIVGLGRFAAKDDAGGIDWEFEGARPGYDAGRREGEPGEFVWRILEDDPELWGSAATTFDGPGLLWLTPPYLYPRPGFSYRILVNGEEWDGFTNTGDGYYFEEDTIHVKWEFEYDPSLPEFQQTAQANMPIPVFRNDAVVAATAESADVVISEERERYRMGETVTITASEVNQSGEAFSGWWKGNQLYAAERRLELEVREDLTLVARYGHGLINPTTGVTVLGGESSWQVDEEVQSPLGASTIKSRGDSDLLLQSLEAGVLEFSLRIDDADGTLTLDKPWSGDGGTVSLRSGGGWKKVAVYLEAGETLRMVYEGKSPEYIHLGDLNTSPGWGPNLIYPVGVDIEIDSEESEQWVVVTAVGIASERLVGWRRENGVLKRQDSIRIEEGDEAFSRIFLSDGLETSLGSVQAAPAEAWAGGSNTGIEDGGPFLWKSALGGLDGESHALTMTLEGPIALRFSVKGAGYLGYLLDDGPYVEIPLPRYREEERYINIPSGARELSLVHTASEGAVMELKLDSLEEGFYFEEREYPKGKVLLGGSVSRVNVGDRVEFIAQPDEYSQFARWEAPFAGEARRFSHVVEDPIQPVPVFEPRRLEGLEGYGLVWNSVGLDAVSVVRTTVGGFERELSISGKSNKEGWLESTIEGACVLRLDRSVGFDRFFIDGVAVAEHELPRHYVSEGSIHRGTLYVGVPEGEHRIRWDFSHLDYYNEPARGAVRVLPGYLVGQPQAGVEYVVLPEKESYKAGDVVTLEAITGFDESRIEWRNVPEEAERIGKSIRFAMTDHVMPEVLAMREDRIAGQRLYRSGRGEWISTNRGYRREELGSNEREIIEFRDLKPGSLVIDMDVAGFEESLDIELFRNGEALPIKPVTIRYEKRFLSVIPIQSESDVVMLRVLNQDPYYTSSSPVGFYKLELRESGQEGRYLSWWKGAREDRRLVMGAIDPSADPDRDGVPNYVEFRMNRNPLRAESAFGIRRVGTERKLLLQGSVIGEELEAPFDIQYFTGGAWVDADRILSAEQRDGALWLREVLGGIEGGEALLFRLKYEGDFPSFEELLDED